MKQSWLNALNKSLIKHDEGINNTQLFLISLQDMRLNTEFNRWPITSMKRMDFKSYIPSCWRPPFWDHTLSQCSSRPIQKRNPRQSPANGPRSLLFVETLRNRTAEGRGQQNWSCDARDNLIREPFDATSGLRLPSSWRSRRENKATEVVRRTWVFLSPYFNLNCLFLRL